MAFSSARRSRKRRAAALAGEPDGRCTGARRGVVLRLALGGGHETVADAGDPEAVERDGHRVRRELAGARARPGAGGALDLVQTRAREQASLLGADRLPDVLNRHLAPASLPARIGPL